MLTWINVGVIIVAILHLWFFLLESFLWRTSLGLKTFKMDAEFAKKSNPLAVNQGLYNAFLSAGLLWSLLTPNMQQAFELKVFFLSWIVVAGIYGGISVNFRIFLIQALPAAITLILIGFAG